MSKYIAPIVLLEDNKCYGCPYQTSTLRGHSYCKRLNAILKNATRPADCPLIPVERVIGSVFHLDASVQYGVSTDDVASALRDELGVTE